MEESGKKSKPPFPARLNDFLIIVSARVRFRAEQRLRLLAVELALRRPDDVRVQDGIALVAAVGRKMPSRPGTSGKLFQALGEHGLNIRTIAQGADELSIIVGVENCDFEKAIRVLYDGFTG